MTDTINSFYNDTSFPYTTLTESYNDRVINFGNVNRNETGKDTSLMIGMQEVPFCDFRFVTYPELFGLDSEVSAHGFFYYDGSRPSVAKNMYGSGVKMQFSDGEGKHFFDNVVIQEFCRIANPNQKTRSLVLWKSYGYNRF